MHNTTPAKPDFFMVGAPKCGTTSMDTYLRQHPDIFMGQKEIHYFGADLAFNERHKYHPQTEADYLAYFTDWNGEKRIGESSVFYLSSQHAPHEILTFQPEARIIIMLRNPIELVYSLYFEVLKNLNEDAATFEAALDAEPERREGRLLPRYMSFPNALMYSNIGANGQHVQRYLAIFPRERIHIILYDDFKRDTAQVYRDTLTFLDVDSSFMPDFAVVNPNAVLRNRRLQALMHQSPPLIRRLKQALPRGLRLSIGNQLRRLNRVETKRPELKPETRDRLRDLFREDIHLLGRLLGRDLDHWLSETTIQAEQPR